VPSRKSTAKASRDPRNQAIRAELEAFYAMLRAKAILVAIDWAGSAANLGQIVGYKRYTGMSWAKRGRISIEGAKRLASLPDFPLTVEEMCPGDRTQTLECPHCLRLIYPHGQRTGTLPSFNGRSKAIREGRRKQAQHVAKRSATSS
jgi:hypothetical protein